MIALYRQSALCAAKSHHAAKLHTFLTTSQQFLYPPSIYHKTKWWVDAVLFAAFIVLLILDLTGVALHQWLGGAVGLLAGYHLLTHWKWVQSVSPRLGHTCWQARTYYIVDAGLLLGFSSILLTGLVISTWLDLSLGNLAAWQALHVDLSIATLLLVCLKIGLHWRWIVNIARRYVFSPATGKAPARQSGVTQHLAPQPLPVRVDSERRDFLKLSGVMGAATLIALVSSLDLVESEPASNTSTSAAPETASSSTSTSTSEPAQSLDHHPGDQHRAVVIDGYPGWRGRQFR